MMKHAFGLSSLLAFLLTGVLLTGCGDEPATSERNAGSAAEMNNESRPGTPRSSDSALAIRVLPENPTAGDDLTMVVSGAEGPITCRWKRNGEQLSPEDPNCLPEGNYRKDDVVEVSVTSGGKSVSTSVTIANTPPEVIRVPFEDARIRQGKDIRVAPEAVDMDGDTVSFRYVWSVNGEKMPWIDRPLLSADRFAKGDRISLTVIPSDQDSEGEPYRGQEFLIPNAPPEFTSTPPSRFKSEIYTYRAVAKDPDGDAIVYRLEEAPEQMSIDSASGEIRWPVSAADEGSHAIRIVCEDEEGMQAVQEYSIEIAIR